MDACLAATGPIGVEAFLIAAALLIAGGIVLARRAAGLSARAALLVAPLLLAALVVGGAPAAPAFASQVDCPPMEVISDDEDAAAPDDDDDAAPADPDTDEPGTDEPGTDEPGDGVTCETATTRAVEIFGLFRERGESRDQPFTAVRFEERDEDLLRPLVDEFASAGLSYGAAASISAGDGTTTRAMSATFDPSGAFVDVVETAGDPLPRGFEAFMTLTTSIALPAADGCEASVILLTLEGFLVEVAPDFELVDPCATDQITSIALAGTWISQQGSAGGTNATLNAFMSYTSGNSQAAADLLERGTRTNAVAELSFSNGTSAFRDVTVQEFSTTGGIVEIRLDVTAPSGTSVTSIEATLTYTVPGLEGCDPDVVFLTFAGPANLAVINS